MTEQKRYRVTDDQLRKEYEDNMKRKAAKEFRAKVVQRLSEAGYKDLLLTREQISKVSTLPQRIQDKGGRLLNVDIEAKRALEIIDEVIKDYEDNNQSNEGGLF